MGMSGKKFSCRRVLRSWLFLSDKEYDLIKLLPNEKTSEAAKQVIQCVRQLRAIRAALLS